MTLFLGANHGSTPVLSRMKYSQRDSIHTEGTDPLEVVVESSSSSPNSSIASQPKELIVEENTDCELLCVKVRVKGSSDLYIGSFYSPPDKTDPEYLQCLQTTINRIPTDKAAHLWLGGDFNLPDINWEEETVAPYGSYSTLSNQLLTVMRDSFLDQVVMKPTSLKHS